MRLDSLWRRWFGGRGARQALGCALSDAGGALVWLARVQDGQVRVVAQSLLDGPAPDPQARQDPHDAHVSIGLRQAIQAQRQSARRCVLALPESACASGQLPWPTDAAEDLLEAEVLLEAAQALQAPLTDIGYDFEPGPWQAPGASGLCCRWSAARAETLSHWRRSLRAAGLRLEAVEPQEQAVRRALTLIEGAGDALWRQAPQDWIFRPVTAPGPQPDRPLDLHVLRADERVEHVWPQLVACGLALRCWQEPV